MSFLLYLKWTNPLASRLLICEWQQIIIIWYDTRDELEKTNFINHNFRRTLDYSTAYNKDFFLVVITLHFFVFASGSALENVFKLFFWPRAALNKERRQFAAYFELVLVVGIFNYVSVPWRKNKCGSNSHSSEIKGLCLMKVLQKASWNVISSCIKL